MAGLQYNFFPTDFLYPRPPLADAAPKSVVPVQNRRRVVADDVVLDELQQPKDGVSFRRNDVVALRGSETARAPAPLIRQKQRQGGSPNSLSSLFPEQSSD